MQTNPVLVDRSLTMETGYCNYLIPVLYWATKETEERANYN